MGPESDNRRHRIQRQEMRRRRTRQATIPQSSPESKSTQPLIQDPYHPGQLRGHDRRGPDGRRYQRSYNRVLRSIDKRRLSRTTVRQDEKKRTTRILLQHPLSRNQGGRYGLPLLPLKAPLHKTSFRTRLASLNHRERKVIPQPRTKAINKRTLGRTSTRL